MVLGDFLWTLFVVFFMVIYFMMLFRIILDIFSNHDMNGWIKAFWLIFILIIPLFSMLIYIIVYGSSMAKRGAEQAAAMEKQQQEYIKNVANSSDTAADQIERAHSLLKQGAITQEEFDGIKARVLAEPAKS